VIAAVDPSTAAAGPGGGRSQAGPRALAAPASERIDPLEIAGRSFAQCLSTLANTYEWDGTPSWQARVDRCIEARDTALEWALWDAVDLEACRTATLDRAEASCAALLKYVDKPLSCRELPSYCAARDHVRGSRNERSLATEIDLQKVPGAQGRFGEAMKALSEARGRLAAPHAERLQPLLGAVSGSLHKTCTESDTCLNHVGAIVPCATPAAAFRRHVEKGGYVLDVANRSPVDMSCGLRLDRHVPGRQVVVDAGKRGALKVDTDTCNITDEVECAVPVDALAAVSGGDLARAFALHRVSEQGGVSPSAEVVLHFQAVPALVRASLSVEPSRRP
jgi:hypothetical protein